MFLFLEMKSSDFTEFLEAGPGSPEDLALKCTVVWYN